MLDQFAGKIQLSLLPHRARSPSKVWKNYCSRKQSILLTDRQIFEISPSSSILEVREDSEKALREMRGRKNIMSKHFVLDTTVVVKGLLKP
ncbi:MAG: hypothetical protein ACTSUQ_01365 [Candidatus Freyarchaeota archaeon]